MILPHRCPNPVNCAAKPPQLLTRVNFGYRFVNKFVAFLQHAHLNERGKPASGSLGVALVVGIRIVHREEGKQMRAFFISRGRGDLVNRQVQPATNWRQKMNIKSLLIGSAAALVAVSGARAADAVVAEPEAVEYVRVCDAYGAGFFYIPGTETCLKIGGYARYQIDFSDDDNGWRKTAKAVLNFTASSDTELGTLTSYIEMSAARISGAGGLVFDDKNNNGIINSGELTINGTFNLDHAWISLGGLKMGYSDTLFDGDINGEFDSYGGQGVHFISYTFSGGNGFSAALSLEEENYDVDYVPNIVGKVSYSAGSVGVDLWAAYDDADDTLLFDDEFALKGRVSFKASDALTIQAAATYNSGPSIYSNGYEWSLGASAKYQVNEKLALTAGGQYLADAFGTTNDDFAIGAVVAYTIVPGFDSTLAVNYKDGDSYSDGAFSGFLRFQRSF
jgi:hypothetical protein